MDDLKKPIKSGDANAEATLKTMQPEGSWKSIPYQSKERSVWPPIDHLQNLQI